MSSNHHTGHLKSYQDGNWGYRGGNSVEALNKKVDHISFFNLKLCVNLLLSFCYVCLWKSVVSFLLEEGVHFFRDVITSEVLSGGTSDVILQTDKQLSVYTSSLDRVFLASICSDPGV